MSDEKRFTNKKLIAVSIMLVLFIGTTGVLGFMYLSVNDNYTNLSGDYDSLYTDHLELLIDFNNLDDQYFILTGEHIELENDYNILVIALTDMTAERDVLDNELIVMTAERDNLVIALVDMTAERDNLVIALADMTAERDNLLAEILVLEGQAVIDEQTIADLNAQIVVLNAEIVGHLSTIAGLQTTIETRDATILDLNAQISTLETERNNLQNELDIMTADYNALLDDYQILFDANADLQIIYDILLIAYNSICNTIKQSILPVQYSIFAEAVRRYYGDSYLDFHPLNPPKWYWAGFARFCRDMILHDSNQYNYFTAISNAFSDVLKYGNNTMSLARTIMFSTFYNWLPNWGGWGLTGDELIDINTIVDWCINEIEYEYDSSITYGQEYFDWDYIKFPVETAFRTMGDCEDQAILAATYLESCGFETAIAISHDPAHPTLGEFYHGSLLVHIEDTDAYYLAYSSPLWTIPYDPYSGYTWAWLDTTWDVPFGTTPSWLQDYSDFGGLTIDVITLAYCDVGGAIGTNTIENIDITCVMST